MSIDQQAFIDSLGEAFELPGSEKMTSSTRFQELEQWDSLASVSTVAMVFTEYDVQISGDELLHCETVADIQQLVEGKLLAAA